VALIAYDTANDGERVVLRSRN